MLGRVHDAFAYSLEHESNVRFSPAVSAAPTFIEVTEVSGEWFVRIVEDGEQTVTSFELESFAESFAEGQRIRLGLDEVIHP